MRRNEDMRDGFTGFYEGIGGYVAAGDLKRGKTHLCVLDFDKAEATDFLADWKTCCKQMVTALTANDSYYPNPVQPGEQERAIWNAFEQAYIQAAQVILDIDFRLDADQTKSAEKLPKRLIKEWKKVAHRQMDAQDGEFIDFWMMIGDT